MPSFLSANIDRGRPPLTPFPWRRGRHAQLPTQACLPPHCRRLGKTGSGQSSRHVLQSASRIINISDESVCIARPSPTLAARSVTNAGGHSGSGKGPTPRPRTKERNLVPTPGNIKTSFVINVFKINTTKN